VMKLVTAVIPLREFTSDKYLFMATRQGDRKEGCIKRL